jgi:hypothetical protein
VKAGFPGDFVPRKDAVDLSFAFRPTKGGDVTILRNGLAVTVLRGDSAGHFLAQIRDAAFSEQQQLMARVTGKYSRGNERCAASHPRNRGQNDG